MFKFLENWLLCQDRSVCESIHDSYRQLDTKWLSEYQHHVWKWNYSWWITGYYSKQKNGMKKGDILVKV